MNPPNLLLPDRRLLAPIQPAAEPEPSLRQRVASVIDLTRHVICCPVGHHVEPETSHSLDCLKEMGFRVDMLYGASAIDITRSMAASTYLMDGLDSMLFVDSDMQFDAADALTLLLSDEPVVAGCYAAKKLGKGKLNCVFEPGLGKVKFGPWATELYPARCYGAGFMRIKMSALAQIKDRLGLEYCRIADTHGWPFFLPAVTTEDSELRYLGEDYAFCWRCREAGIQPMVDTSFRVWHVGSYRFGLEEAMGYYIQRQRNLECDFQHAVSADPVESLVATT